MKGMLSTGPTPSSFLNGYNIWIGIFFADSVINHIFWTIWFLSSLFFCFVFFRLCFNIIRERAFFMGWLREWGGGLKYFGNIVFIFPYFCNSGSNIKISSPGIAEVAILVNTSMLKKIKKGLWSSSRFCGHLCPNESHKNTFK